jgi:hypothetical protein
VSFINGLFKFYAYLFHLALNTFLIGIAVLARVSHQPLHLEMVPFDEQDMISRISLLSLIGFICIFLALVRIFEFVFPLWSLAVLVLLVWGFFLNSYSSATQAALVSFLALVREHSRGHKAQYPRAELTCPS